MRMFFFATFAFAAVTFGVAPGHAGDRNFDDPAATTTDSHGYNSERCKDVMLSSLPRAEAGDSRSWSAYAAEWKSAMYVGAVQNISVTLCEALVIQYITPDGYVGAKYGLNRSFVPDNFVRSGSDGYRQLHGRLVDGKLVLPFRNPQTGFVYSRNPDGTVAVSLKLQYVHGARGIHTDTGILWPVLQN